MASLNGKRVLVTGASTGIGRATAIRIASEGACVALFDINDSDAESTVRTIVDSGGGARYWHVDVTDEQEVSHKVDEAADWLGGGIDVLAHLAGILKGSGLEITSVDDSIWDPVIEVNLKGSYIVAKHVTRYMIAQRNGVIILTSSGAGVVGGSSSVAYGSSKGGTHGMAMTLDTHLSKHGIRVNDVLPGGLETPLKIGATEEHLVNTGDRKAYENTMAGLSSPDGVAAVIAFLASDDADYIRGSIRTI